YCGPSSGPLGWVRTGGRGWAGPAASGPMATRGWLVSRPSILTPGDPAGSAGYTPHSKARPSPSGSVEAVASRTTPPPRGTTLTPPPAMRTTRAWLAPAEGRMHHSRPGWEIRRERRPPAVHRRHAGIGIARGVQVGVRQVGRAHPRATEPAAPTAQPGMLHVAQAVGNQRQE